MNNSNILVFGAGAVGTTLAAWLHESGQKVSLYARQGKAAELKESGIRLTKDSDTMLVRPDIIDLLEPDMDFDVIILTVKNYQLETACHYINDKLDQRRLQNTTVLGLQNGLYNQTVLPKYFRRPAFGVVFYNVWETSVGWKIQKNGPIVLGSQHLANNQLNQLRDLLKPAVPCEVSEVFNNVVHDKIVSNLVNSITTVIGNSQTEAHGLSALQKVLSHITAEALNTIRKSGYQRSTYSRLPADSVIRIAPYVPAWITRNTIRQKMAMIGQTSMTTDVEQSKGETELDSINGYLLTLATQNKVAAPLSQKLYDICKLRFSQRPFKPMTSEQLWQALST